MTDPSIIAAAPSIGQLRASIRCIDKQIDAERRDGTRTHRSECELFRQRGEVQSLLAVAESLALRSAFRSKPAKKCPACKGSGRAQVTA